MSKIFYIGSCYAGSTSMHRAEALRRLKHDVHVLDPYIAMSSHIDGKIYSRVHYHTGYKFIQQKVLKWIGRYLGMIENSDVVWIDSGELFGPDILVLLMGQSVPIVLFNHDDPTGRRDGNRFRSLRQALPYYSIVTAVRQDSFDELSAICPGRVLRIWRAYDEIQHRPPVSNAVISKKFQSDVCFVGTWMRGEGRDSFLAGLVRQGLNLSIWGDRWSRSPLWDQISPYWRGPALSGRDYVHAIAGSKICIGLLSKGNRDLHTTRSMEIPYAGGLLCAERTSEHVELYQEGRDAVFWDNVDECVTQCRVLLADDQLRESIRIRGRQRVLELGVGNETICQNILNRVLSI